MLKRMGAKPRLMQTILPEHLLVQSKEAMHAYAKLILVIGIIMRDAVADGNVQALPNIQDSKRASFVSIVMHAMYPLSSKLCHTS